MKFDSVVLAGGQSRRMGQDKGLMGYTPEEADSHELASKPMGVWVADALAGCDNLWVNANEQQQAYESLGYSVIPDVFHEDIGPLAGPLLGILTGLQNAKSDWVLFSPCDTPNIPENYAEKMAMFARDNLSYANVVFDGQRRQNLHLFLHKSLSEDLLLYLLSGGRKTYQWLDRVNAKEVDFSDQQAAFKNFNAPEDID